MNWTYLFAGLIRRYIPRNLLFLILEIRGDSSLEETTPSGCLKMWKEQLELYNLSFDGKDILEIGSGRYARFALQMIAQGAKRVTLVDPYASQLSDSRHQELLIKDCATLNLSHEHALAKIRVIKKNITDLPVPPSDGKVDLVISHSVLEHVREPDAVMKCCLKWLKPGGITHHIIDLRDHNLRFRYPFEMLTFSAEAWSRWLDLGGGLHLNRWRAPDYLEAIEKAGFVNTGYEVLLRDESALRAVSPRLHARYRSIPESQLAILSMSLHGQKPSARFGCN